MLCFGNAAAGVQMKAIYLYLYIFKGTVSKQGCSMFNGMNMGLVTRVDRGCLARLLHKSLVLT